MSEWKPIETAPKDGTVFLAYIPDGRERSWYPGIGEGQKDFVWVCTWDKHSDPQSGLYPGWSQPLNANAITQPVYRLNPTHWVPLPPPPSPNTTEQKGELDG